MASRMASHAQEINIVGNGNVFSIVLQKTNQNWFAYDWPSQKHRKTRRRHLSYQTYFSRSDFVLFCEASLWIAFGKNITACTNVAILLSYYVAKSNTKYLHSSAENWPRSFQLYLCLSCRSGNSFAIAWLSSFIIIHLFDYSWWYMTIYTDVFHKEVFQILGVNANKNTYIDFNQELYI